MFSNSDMEKRLRADAQSEKANISPARTLPPQVRAALPETAERMRQVRARKAEKRQNMLFGLAILTAVGLCAGAVYALACGLDIGWIARLPLYGAGIAALLGPILAYNKEVRCHEAH